MIDDLPALGDWTSFEELRRLQDKALGPALEWAARSPWHRSRPAMDTALENLPLTTKADLRASYPFGMLAVPGNELATYHESSGTSGEPTSSYFTERDWDDVVDRFCRNAVDLHAADTVLVRTPYAMLTTAHQAHSGARRRGATVVPADNRSLVMSYPRVVRLLHDLPVTVAWCLPSECLLWAAAACDAGREPRTDFPRLRSFLVAGEPLSQARRARIAAIWGTEVRQDYGSTETGSLAGECPHGALHLWSDRFVPQVFDPATGVSTPDGVGELVITTLYRQAMPLVRYHLGDRVEVRYEDCPCGWTLPTVRVLGRDTGAVRIGSDRIAQHRLEPLVFGLDERYRVWFWRARRRDDVLEIQIEVADRYRADACADLTAAVRDGLGVRCTVDGLSPGSLAPKELFGEAREFTKPRNLFDEDEDWGRAVIYC